MAAIDLNTVRSTIEARLATELASSPAIPVIFNNMAFDSTTEDSFVQCLTSFGSHEYLTQGDTTNSVNSVVGLITLNIYTEEGIGAGSNFVIGKRIRDLYNRVTVSNVIFDSPIPTGSKVQAEYSYKYINVVYANSVPWLRQIQYRTYEPNGEFLTAGKGAWDDNPEKRLQLPAIAIEVVPRRQMRGYQLGGGQWVQTDILFHCIAEDSITRNALVDMVSFQNDKTIHMFNSNSIADSGHFPLDYMGVPVSGAKMYPDLAKDHYSKDIRLQNASIQGMDMINNNLFGGIVKLTAEVIQTNI